MENIAAHTRVPNQLLDLVIPRLSPAEQACILYILRRTYGFVSATDSNKRKVWDRIALSQFINGNQSSQYVLDLGTGLSKTATIKALNSLEEKSLVKISYECPTTINKNGQLAGCGWTQAENLNMKLEIDEKTLAYRCPRCHRTLSKLYSLRTLTPGFIKRFLNATETDKCTWEYDPEIERFYKLDNNKVVIKEVKFSKEAVSKIEKELYNFKQAQEIIAQAEIGLKTSKMSLSRKVNGFYQPILDIQKEFPKEAVEYALNEVIKRKIVTRSNNRNWYNYAKTVAKNYQAQNIQEAFSLKDKLILCAELNNNDEHVNAKAILDEILSNHLEAVSNKEFHSDKILAKRHILEAFKRGIEDYHSPREYVVAVDYLPEWNWEKDISKYQ